MSDESGQVALHFSDVETPRSTDGTAADRRYVLASSYTVFPLFSRGCLVPAMYEQDGDEAPEAVISKTLPVWSGSIPAEFVAATEEGARNIIPLALELKEAAEVRELATDGGYIPMVAISDIRAIWFRHDEEMRRFRSWSYQDVDLDAVEIPMKCSPSVFSAEPEQAVPMLPAIHDSQIKSVRAAVRRADMYLGFMASALGSCGPSDRELGDLKRLLDLELIPKNDFDSSPELETARALFGIGTAPTAANPNSDTLLLTACVSTLASYPGRAGWPAKEVLERIRSVAVETFDQRGGNGAPLEEIEDWVEYCEKALTAESTEVRWTLSDAGSVVRRGILLLLLRGEPLAIEADRDSQGTVVIGKRVRRLALLLASLRYGLRALPTDLKFGSGVSSKSLLSHSADLFANIVPHRELERMTPARHTKLRYDEGTEYRGRLELTIGSEVLRSIPADTPPGLRKVSEDCRYYGYEVKRLSAHSLEVSSGEHEKLARPVRVSLLEERSSQDKIRFSCTAYPLAKTKRRSSHTPELERALKQVSKDKLLRLLISNSAEATACRVAVSPTTAEVVVIVDQLLGTMDRDECIAHLENASSLASSLAAEKR
jgi:hypothetical protein